MFIPTWLLMIVFIALAGYYLETLEKEFLKFLAGGFTFVALVVLSIVCVAFHSHTAFFVCIVAALVLIAKLSAASDNPNTQPESTDEAMEELADVQWEHDNNTAMCESDAFSNHTHEP
jgi:hypothetical protein